MASLPSMLISLSPADQCPDLYPQAVSAAASTKGSLLEQKLLVPACDASYTSLLMYWGIA